MADVVIRWLDGDELRSGGLDAIASAQVRRPLWVDVTAPDEATLTELAAAFGLHPLAVEDVLHDNQRPKINNYASGPFLVWLVPRREHGRIRSSEVDVFLGVDWLVTCHAEPLAAIDTVAVDAADLLAKGVVWVVHGIVDRATDVVLPLVDAVTDELDHLEDALMDSPQREALRGLQAARRRLRSIHRILGPERDVLRALVREDRFVSIDAYRYFQDVGDHLARAQDAVDTARDIGASAMDVYLSQVSNNLNMVMKRLTIVTTVFLPGTLIAGIYGMNFQFMPELGWNLGYPFVLGLMVVVTGGMLYWFKRSDWW